MTLKLTNIHKSYSGNPVLKGVDFEVRPGEVHALLGPNGAGKSTLINCISGGTAITSGEATLDGKALDGLTPSRAFEAGIVTIHQHLSLIDTISVMDNLFFGTEIRKFGFTNRAKQRSQARQLLAQHGINASPSAIVGDLPIGVRQQIEIAKAWNKTSIKVLILDEPTAAISGKETEILFEKINALRDSGVAVIYTTHRMAEVFRIADRVTVINSGVAALSGYTADLAPHDVVDAISAGSGHEAQSRSSDENTGRIVASVQNLAGLRFGPLSFSIAEGEIVGLFGAVGSGRTSLMETVVGCYRRRGTVGSITLGDKPYAPRSPAHALKNGIRFVASDRATQGLWRSLAASENVLMPRYHQLSCLGLRRSRGERSEFEQIVDELALEPAEPRMKAEEFSGGNQQKIVVGRTGLGTAPIRLLILDEPTQGVDVGARARIYTYIRRLVRKHKCGVLVASSEPDEIEALCDRVLVMSEGTIEKELSGDEISERNMMLAAHQFVAQPGGTMPLIQGEKQ
ncbi:sugar ABC transporter ATP-binding protein [Paramicrobacterium chengjingii]|uniref:sugar ABC transporter ATP-binding protein n=1 Tax=Paramicrobacterium chengjingii TaxID=2769067 RepID=UPI001420BCF2|nr:sugar ABC transporter ATP-binding protein [Microbacterium chengjingii]